MHCVTPRSSAVLIMQILNGLSLEHKNLYCLVAVVVDNMYSKFFLRDRIRREPEDSWKNPRNVYPAISHFCFYDLYILRFPSYLSQAHSWNDNSITNFLSWPQKLSLPRTISTSLPVLSQPVFYIYNNIFSFSHYSFSVPSFLNQISTKDLFYPFLKTFFFGGGDFFYIFFSYYIQHCFICRPSDSTVPTDAGIEPRTVATGALAVRRSNH